MTPYGSTGGVALDGDEVRRLWEVCQYALGNAGDVTAAEAEDLIAGIEQTVGAPDGEPDDREEEQ